MKIQKVATGKKNLLSSPGGEGGLRLGFLGALGMETEKRKQSQLTPTPPILSPADNPLMHTFFRNIKKFCRVLFHVTMVGTLHDEKHSNVQGLMLVGPLAIMTSKQKKIATFIQYLPS